MIALALASYLVTQTWAWDAVPEAEGYYLYWTQCCDATSCFWPTSQSVTLPAQSPICVGGECQGDIPAVPDSGLVFFAVTAFNEYGESSTEHGEVGPCP